MDHAVNTKLNSCDCVLHQTMLLPCRHVIFRRMQNMCETVLPPYNGFASRWMREVNEGCVQMQTLPKMVELKAMRGTNKYTAAKACMEKISTPTFRAALHFLDSITSALHKGKFAVFAVGFTANELAIVKMEPNAVNTTVTSLQSKPEKSVPACNHEVQSTMTKKQHDNSSCEKKLTSQATFTSKVHRFVEEKQREVKRTAIIREARVEAKKTTEMEKTIAFGDMQALLADTYSWSSVKATMDDISFEKCAVEGEPEVRTLEPGEPLPQVTHMLELKEIERVRGKIPYSIDNINVVSWKGYGDITQEQLVVMEQIINVKNVLRDVGFTLKWIEGVTGLHKTLTATLTG
ncbi:hypothetical protein PHMEG_00028871 [Phytophthora megakarya]|uniref:SWIM-type domain-containing protein n=1 Tax=Phytophthora megakarya TaxID=4795 RepID=A0A225V5L5_9STRA|nr:hypothetical protein PHMEG_00028871 [Phytophthora megakarya]